MGLYEQIRKGSTSTLILSLLDEGPMYGYQITQELERRSEGYFEMKEGLLYPTLHRMEQDGLLQSEWQSVAGSRQRKYYRITDKGKKVLADSVAEWQTFIEQLLGIIGRPRESEAVMVGGQ